jgi:hypothetical protein
MLAASCLGRDFATNGRGACSICHNRVPYHFSTDVRGRARARRQLVWCDHLAHCSNAIASVFFPVAFHNHTTATGRRKDRYEETSNSRARFAAAAVAAATPRVTHIPILVVETVQTQSGIALLYMDHATTAPLLCVWWRRRCGIRGSRRSCNDNPCCSIALLKKRENRPISKRIQHQAKSIHTATTTRSRVADRISFHDLVR